MWTLMWKNRKVTGQKKTIWSSEASLDRINPELNIIEAAWMHFNGEQHPKESSECPKDFLN